MAFDSLSEKLQNIFKNLRGKGRLSEADVKAALKEVKLALLEADVNFKVVKQFIKSVEERAIGQDVMSSLTPGQMVIKIVNEEMVSLMGSETTEIDMKPGSEITVIMMAGLQGAGKTTATAKIAGKLKLKGKKPLLVACDIYRPAAIQQLEVVGNKAGVPVFQMGTENPVKIAQAAVAHAKDHGNDVVILDTAGRLHIDEDLMTELKNIKNKVEPQEILLVVDAMTGQDAVNVAKSFNDLLEISGVILTKLDGDTRGGAALSVRAVTGKPIKFSGIGEKLEDLEAFHPDRMASRILGMGDMLSLIEDAQNKLDEKKAREMAEKLTQNQLDLNDLLDQFQQVRKMGPLKGILGKLPGVDQKKLDEANVDDRIMDRMCAIILSMTPAERAKPSIINPSRKRRIAAGSGMKVEDVNRLLRQFEQMQKMMKQMGGKKGKRRRGMFPPMNMGGMGGMGGRMPF